ncbi:MAG TPA: c-type cytochrome [Acidimicrobiales bacterium]|nr:c-type cytochrome [Acidimicrobiales bacterium]
MIRRVTRSRYALPAALMLAVGLGSVLSLASGAQAAPKQTTPTGSYSTQTTNVAGTGHHVVLTAGGTHFVNTKPRVTPHAPACTQDAQRIGYKSPKDSGSPQNSTPTFRKCVNGKVVQYGSPAITYSLPPSSYIAAGHKLFEENCSSCHLSTAQGSAAAPSLHGVGPATVDFWITTGRMPAATPLQIQAEQKPARLTDKQAEEVAAWINSLTPAAPYIPDVHTKGADLTKGATLFALNCAACHTITGAGDALAFGTYSPTLRLATPTQAAEAIRTGPGNMPRFTGNLSDAEVRDVVAYVTEKVQHPENPGGFGLGGVGPVAEGFVALLFGVGGLMLVSFWIGDRSS